MAVATLFDMAKRQIIRNITMLEDVGELPYEFLRPILLKIENPDQLHRLERNSPQIASKTGEIWLRYIHRDFQNSTKLLPEDIDPDEVPKRGWHHLYVKVKRKSEESLREQEDALRATLSALKTEKESKTTKLVEQTLVPQKARRRKLGSSSSSSGGPSLRGLTPGQAALARARRERTEVQMKRASGVPNQPPRVTAGVSKAPVGMVQDYQRSAPVREGSGVIRAPRKNSEAPFPTGADRQSALAAREARLRGLTGGGPSSSTGPASTSPKPPATSSTRSAPEAMGMSHSPPSRPERVSLPTNSAFKVPQMRASPDASSTPPIIKRKRPASNIFMPAKKK